MRDDGFTLLEVLIVISIVGILSVSSIEIFKLYISRSAYSVAQQTLYDARTALESGPSEVDSTVPFLPYQTQTNAGKLSDPIASRLLPSFRNPKNVHFSLSHDPDCSAGWCVADFMTVKHCKASEYLMWERLGNGLDLTFEHLPGGGC